MSTVVTQLKALCPSMSPIHEEFEQQYFWNTMLQYWRLPQHIKHFPGANPMSIEQSDFERLKNDDFLAALKTDGVRYILLLTCKPNSSDPIAIMIDRAKNMYEIEIWANEDFFTHGTLMDGELVWENDMLVYITFDVMLAKGVQCSHLSYRERLQILHNTILCVSSSHSDESIESMISEESKLLARNNEYNLSVIPKKCVPKAQLKTLWEERTGCCHRNDGIIFTLNNSGVETGTSPSVLKWKPAHSIDIYLDRHADDSWKILCNTNTSNELIDISSSVSDLQVQLVENKLIETIEQRFPCIVECVITVRDGTTLVLVPERERSDKVAPNSLKTIIATIRNELENISSADLIDLIGAFDVC